MDFLFLFLKAVSFSTREVYNALFPSTASLAPSKNSFVTLLHQSHSGPGISSTMFILFFYFMLLFFLLLFIVNG